MIEGYVGIRGFAGGPAGLCSGSPRDVLCTVRGSRLKCHFGSIGSLWPMLDWGSSLWLFVRYRALWSARRPSYHFSYYYLQSVPCVYCNAHSGACCTFFHLRRPVEVYPDSSVYSNCICSPVFAVSIFVRSGQAFPVSMLHGCSVPPYFSPVPFIQTFIVFAIC